MEKKENTENAINVVNQILKILDNVKDKSGFLREIGLDKGFNIERNRLKREITDRNITGKDIEDLYLEQMLGNLAKFKAKYLLIFYYEGLNISKKHKVMLDS